MKKILLSFLISVALYAPAKSQSLQNTYWSMYVPVNSFFACFHFTADSLFFSTDSVIYIPVSYFATNADTMFIADLNGGSGCPVTDTGKYIFSIQNDTLNFTLISDPCINRSGVLDLCYGVAMTTGIKNELYAAPYIGVYPNPAPYGNFKLTIADNRTGYSKLVVTAADGKMILQEEITGDGQIEKMINLANYPRGIYFLLLYSNHNVKSFKLFK